MKFREDLTEFKKRKKEDVLKMCEVVKQDILAGNYQVSTSGMGKNKIPVFIKVKVTFKPLISYGRQILVDFFKKEGLELVCLTSDELSFKLD